MDTKKILLMGGLLLCSAVVFMQVKKLGTPPPPAPVALSKPQPVVIEKQMARVLVASTNVYMGTRLNSEMLKWQEWPEDGLTESLINQEASPNAMEELSGAIVRAEMTAGEPVSRRKLVQGGNRSVMSALLKPGMRAVSVRISADTAASGFINPGDRVDIMLTRRNIPQPGAPDTGPSFSAQTIFENVEVLAIDQTYTAGVDGNVTVIGSIALFQLSQEDSEILTAADSVGELSLTLRGLSNSRAASAPSKAKIAQEKESRVSSLKIYRSGATEEVTLQDQ